ncbi:hypothetical protein MRB53_012407 [Persea americana]|uniref:Uncharacterized protein n=1 Tax=Persea americana TaxID=3435 RepID=A0ACC2LXK5_PERAE|nr:hypothetical protein MRB53_012407 [Persea americana]
MAAMGSGWRSSFSVQVPAKMARAAAASNHKNKQNRSSPDLLCQQRKFWVLCAGFDFCTAMRAAVLLFFSGNVRETTPCFFSGFDSEHWEQQHPFLLRQRATGYKTLLLLHFKRCEGLYNRGSKLCSMSRSSLFSARSDLLQPSNCVAAVPCFQTKITSSTSVRDRNFYEI